MEDGSTGACSLTASSPTKITSDLFEAYLKWPTKCWLRATGEPETGNLYSEWVKSQNESFRAAETERLLAETPDGEIARTPCLEYLKRGRWRIAVDVPVAMPNMPRVMRRAEAQVPVPQPSALNSQPGKPRRVTSAATSNGDVSHSANGNRQFAIESLLHAVERVHSGGRGRSARFLPIRLCSSTN